MTSSRSMPALMTCRGRVGIRAVFDPQAGTWLLMVRGPLQTMAWLLHRRWSRVGVEVEIRPPRAIRSLGNLRRFCRYHRDLWRFRALCPPCFGRRP